MTTIHDAIKLLEQEQPKSAEEAQRFLSGLSEEVQEQLIAAIYIGRDHIHANEFIEGAEISRKATDHIAKKEYARILEEKSSSLQLYLGSLKRCAAAGGFDLANL